MIDFDVIAYTMLGISSSVSALQIGRWILNANPRSVVNAGRWSLAALTVLTPVILLWLVTVSYTHLTLPTILGALRRRSARWSRTTASTEALTPCREVLTCRRWVRGNPSVPVACNSVHRDAAGGREILFEI